MREKEGGFARALDEYLARLSLYRSCAAARGRALPRIKAALPLRGRRAPWKRII